MISTLLNFVGILVFGIICFLIYSKKFDARRIIGYSKDGKYTVMISRNMYFITFIIATAPFFFGQFSLIKYLLFFCFLIYILCQHASVFKYNIIVYSYMLFYIWVVIRGAYFQQPLQCFLVLLKYILPLLTLWASYNSINDKYDLQYFCDKVIRFAVFYGFIIGGFSAVFMPWLYYSPIGGMFLTYAGLADYFSAIFVLPLMAFYTTREKKYIYIALWLVLSTVLEGVRTGIGAMTLCTAIFFLYTKRAKSIPLLGMIGAIFIGIVLFVPSINEKFFGEKAGEIEASDIITGDAMSLDNMQTSGRSELWEFAMNRLYKGNELIGSGSGMANNLIKVRGHKLKTVALLHNDYVQILCDNGIIGIILFASFLIITLIYTFRCASKNHDDTVQILATMSGASLGAVAFSMFFDNVVGHSMTSFIIPFVFIGFMCKIIDTEEK